MGDQNKMKYRVKDSGNITILAFQGDIDVSVAAELKKVLQEIIDAGRFNVLVDFGDVNFIDSSGLGLFVVFYKKAREKGGTIKFANVPPVVSKVIKLTRLDKHFELYESLSEGEQGFR